MHTQIENFVRAASVNDVREAGRLVVAIAGHTILLIHESDNIYAVDNLALIWAFRSIEER